LPQNAFYALFFRNKGQFQGYTGVAKSIPPFLLISTFDIYVFYPNQPDFSRVEITISIFSISLPGCWCGCGLVASPVCSPPMRPAFPAELIVRVGAWIPMLIRIYCQNEIEEIEMQDSLEDSKKLAELLATDWFRTFAFTI